MKIVYGMGQCNIPYGGSRIIFEQATRLKARGHEVEIWTFWPYQGKPPFPTNVRIIEIPHTYDTEQEKLLELFPQNTDAMTPDVFIAGSFPFAFAVDKLPGVRFYWYLQHDWEGTRYNGSDYPNDAIVRTYNSAFSLPLHFLSNSQWTQRTIQERHGVSSALIRCGIDTQLFSPKNVEKSFPTVLATFNTLIWKGFNDLMQAMNIVLEKFPDARLALLAGQIPEGIRTTGSIQLIVNPLQSDLSAIYSSADVFVSPSWSEGFGLPGLEAMACGVPVVTTDSGGVKEYATHNENCLMVAPKNPEQLAHAIIQMLTDRRLKEKCIKNGILKAKEFGWEQAINDLESILHHRS